MWSLCKKKPEAPKPAARESPRPLVDDAYWFERSKDMVQGASSKRTEAAGKLQTTIGWFWTIYAAAAVVGVSFADKDFGLWASILIVLPIPFLVLAYWLAGWAQIPVGVQFDPRAPDEIRLAHEYSARKKKQRLGSATLVSLIGALFVTIAILTASYVDDESEPEPGFAAVFDDGGTNPQLAVGGDFPSGSRVVITVTPKDGTARRRIAVAPSSGEVQQVIRVPVAASYEVTATWDEEKVGTRSLTKMVAGQKSDT
jgi:hypothetical protein